MHETATDPDQQIVALLNLDVDSLLSKLVDAFGLSQEEDLHPLSLRILVDEIGEHLVDIVRLLRDVDCLLFRPQLLNSLVQLTYL